MVENKKLDPRTYILNIAAAVKLMEHGKVDEANVVFKLLNEQLCGGDAVRLLYLSRLRGIRIRGL